MQQAEDGRSIKSLLQDLKVQRFDHMNGVESCREKVYVFLSQEKLDIDIQ